MKIGYTDERNTQILVGLLKAHGIKKVVASPGTTNIRFVAAVQYDDWFEVYSAVDERSAAYMACGIAGQSGEPVVLTCTGATASRNYMPALTEAFYRKLPVLAVTSSQNFGRIGQNIAQVIDRSILPNDIAKLSVNIPTCHTTEEASTCNIQINRAIDALTRNGGGPVHINLETTYSRNFTVEQLPPVRVIHRVGYHSEFPEVPNGNIGIFIGAHKKMSADLTDAIDAFCKKYNAVVLCDHTSNYYGQYKVLFPLVTCQLQDTAVCNNFELIVHIGNISGTYSKINSKNQWRVNPDGEIRDSFKKLSYVFEMDETYFFQKYSNTDTDREYGCSFKQQWDSEYHNIYSKIPELPFSNIWIAKRSTKMLPENAVLHLAILNTLRSWNFFEIPSKIEISCNTGGFGIDGILSTALGASLVCPEKNVFCVIGDLAFFYDMNSIGNRHVGNNIRILLINNGKGVEFRNYQHPANDFGEDADMFMAAAGHFGQKSNMLVKHYAEDLGFEYLTASDKEEFLNIADTFFSEEKRDKPMLFEVFTDGNDESSALEIIYNLVINKNYQNKELLKSTLKKTVGQNGYNTIKKIFNK